MAIKTDIEKAKQQAAEEAARVAAMGGYGAVKYWKPKVGQNIVRILPPWTTEGTNAFQWWRQIWQHWNVGPEESKKTVVCPEKTPPKEGKCPICEELERLRVTGDPADLEIAKQMRAQMRVHANIIDLKDPKWTQTDIDELSGEGVEQDRLPEVGDPKVQIWGFGTLIFNDLLDYYTDDMDLADLEDGYNIKIKREGKGINTKYRVRLEQDPSAAPVSDDELKLNNLDNMWKILSEAEILAIMEGVDPQEAKQLEAEQKKALARKAATKQRKLEAAQKAQEEAEEFEPEEEEEEETPEEPQEAPEEEEQSASDADGGNGVSKNWPPLDEEGYLDFDQLTDEQIEDPQNASAQDEEGTSVYLPCFGAARQRDEEDEQCQGCPLLERCGKRIAFLDAPKKKKRGRPPKKKAPGKAASPAPKKAAPKSSDADALMAEMRAAIEKNK